MNLIRNMWCLLFHGKYHHYIGYQTYECKLCDLHKRMKQP